MPNQKHFFPNRNISFLNRTILYPYPSLPPPSPSVSLPHVFLLLRGRRCFLWSLSCRRRCPCLLLAPLMLSFFFVAAGGIFSRFVASSTVLDSLPHVCLLIRCRKCCLCLVAACAVFICFGVACTLGASRPHAFFFFTLSHVLSLFGSVPLVLWVPTLISFHSGHRECRFW